MPYITPTANESGAYPAPQSNPAPGLIPLTDEQAAMVVKYNGFVSITSHEEEYEEGFFRTVYEVIPNLELWEEWKSSQQTSEGSSYSSPSIEERLEAAELAILSMMKERVKNV